MLPISAVKMETAIAMQAATPALSRGAIRAIYNQDTSAKPVVQIIDLKKILQPNVANANPRYRLVISDGEHYQQAMLATQLNQLVSDNLLLNLCLVRMNEYICNQVQNKRIVIILNVEILSKAVEKVGTPISVESALNPASAAPPGQKSLLSQRPSASMGSAQQPLNNVQSVPSFAQNNSFGGGVNKWGERSASSKPGVPSWGGPVVDSKPLWRPSGSGAIAVTNLNAGAGPFRPIQSINPYQRSWIVKGRCTFKSDLRKFQNARGEGKVFSFELTDDSGSIRITGFSETADVYFDMIKLNHIYTVTRAHLKSADVRFNRSTSDYEMTLDRFSEVNEVPDDGTVQKIKYNFVKIAQLEGIEPKTYVDVIAVAQEISAPDEIISRSTGEALVKRSVTLVDDSGASVPLTLWRNHADILNEQQTPSHPIIALRGVRRGDYQGVSLDTGRNTSIDVNPIMPEADALRAWYDSGAGSGASFSALGSGAGGGPLSNDRKSLEEGQSDDVSQLSSDGKSVSFTIRGMVGFVRKEGTMAYPSDPLTKKKVVESAPGVWHSDASDKDFSSDEIKWRYVLSLNIIDHTGTQWMTAFDEAGETIIGRSAVDMEQLRETDKGLWQSVLDDISFRPLVMQVVVKEQMYREDRRIRYTINRVQHVDFASEGRVILKEIQAYSI